MANLNAFLISVESLVLSQTRTNSLWLPFVVFRFEVTYVHEFIRKISTTEAQRFYHVFPKNYVVFLFHSSKWVKLLNGNEKFQDFIQNKEQMRQMYGRAIAIYPSNLCAKNSKNLQFF